MEFLNTDFLDCLGSKPVGEDAWKSLAADLIGQIEESSYFFHQILSSMPHSMMLISATGTVEAASKMMVNKFLETSKNDLIGKSFRDIKFPVFYNCSQDIFIKRILSEALTEGLDYENFLREALDKEQNTIYVEMSVKVLRSETRQILGLLLTFSEQVVRLNLVPSHQEKEQILKKMGSLSAGVIHEVRNPIQSISGIIQLLQLQYPENKDLQTKLSVIMTEINRVNILLSEFLSFSGKEKMEVCYCHINDICEEILSLLQGNCYMNGIELTQNFGDNIPKMVLDHNRIKQVIVNFVVNSIDAIKELKSSDCFEDDKYKNYQGKITVSTKYDYALNECHIAVEDNGIGMNKNLISNITTPFFTTKKYGTGMGVAISNNIIMEYGGRLDVESTPGEGSVFDVVLPELAGLMQLVENKDDPEVRKRLKAQKLAGRQITDEEVERMAASIGVSSFVDIIKDGFSCLEKEDLNNQK